MRKIIGILAFAIVALIVVSLTYGAWFAAVWGFSPAAVLPLGIIALVPCIILVIVGRELMK
jgi:hypothetical protein